MYNYYNYYDEIKMYNKNYVVYKKYTVYIAHFVSIHSRFNSLVLSMYGKHVFVEKKINIISTFI